MEYYLAKRSYYTLILPDSSVLCPCNLTQREVCQCSFFSLYRGRSCYPVALLCSVQFCTNLYICRFVDASHCLHVCAFSSWFPNETHTHTTILALSLCSFSFTRVRVQSSVFHMCPPAPASATRAREQSPAHSVDG